MRTALRAVMAVFLRNVQEQLSTESTICIGSVVSLLSCVLRKVIKMVCYPFINRSLCKHYFASIFYVTSLLLALLQCGDSVAPTRSEVKHIQSKYCCLLYTSDAADE